MEIQYVFLYSVITSVFIHMLAQYEYVEHPNKMYGNSKNWFSSLIPFRYWSCFILLWSLSLFLLILKYLL
jgi:hypothetical protein